MEDLDAEPLMVQKPLESDPFEVPVGSHIGVLVRLLAAHLGHLLVEVLMQLFHDLHGGLAHGGPRQDRGGLVLADLRILEGWVHTEMPVLGSVEIVPAGVLEVGTAAGLVEVGPAEVVPAGVLEVGPAAGLVELGLAEVVPAGVLEVGPDEVVPAGVLEVGPAEVVPAGVLEVVPAEVVPEVFAGDSGSGGLLAQGLPAPS